MFIIDFDYTLYRTDLLVRDMKRVFLRYGVGEGDFQKTYRQSIEWNGDGYGFDYSFAKQIALLQHAGFSIDMKKVLPELNGCIKPEYVFPDAISFLQFLRRRHDTVVLLTAGDPEFQKQKVTTVGIDRLVDQTVYLPGNKEQFVTEHIPEGPIVFINDNSKENAVVKKTAPSVQVIGIKNTFKYSPEEVVGIPYFDTLTEVQTYLAETYTYAP